MIEADTVDERARKTGMNADNLKAAVDGCSAVVRGKKEDGAIPIAGALHRDSRAFVI
ncbi:MAG: hypothetical protein K5841_04980 [Fretibacterium sp.]|nr:hypothetical protein [Fretibacterium sp.]